MLKSVSALLLLFWCLGCRTDSAETLASRKLTPEYGFVMEGPYVVKLFHQYSRTTPKPENFWTPLPEDIQNLEDDFNKSGYRYIDDRIAPLPAYARQYAGFTRRGRKLIYCNFFPMEMEDKRIIGNEKPSLRAFPMLIADGGRRFFSLVYDPEKRRFTDFSPNGSIGHRPPPKANNFR